jgi:DNA-binding PadR family transcriptional regulator
MGFPYGGRMSKENKTVFAILGLLQHEPLSGYDIKKRLEIIHYFWDAGFGQIYPTLKELENLGLIYKQTGDRHGRRERKVYAITTAGRKELAKWLKVPAAKENVRYEILLKLFFGSLNPPEVNLNNISEFRFRNQSNLNTLEQFEGELTDLIGQSPDHLYYWLTVRFGQYVYKAYLQWADEAIALLQNMKKAGDSNETPVNP